MAGRTKKAIVEPSVQEETASEAKFESPIITNIDTKPDLSRLDDEAKLASLSNLLKCIPPQYLQPDNIKDTIYAVARFEPTDEMLEKAKSFAENPPQRFPN